MACVSPAGVPVGWSASEAQGLIFGAGRRPWMSSAIRAAKTTASRSEFEASRFAPCAPVDVTSPQAHNPSSEVRPSTSVRMPPMK